MIQRYAFLSLVAFLIAGVLAVPTAAQTSVCPDLTGSSLRTCIRQNYTPDQTLGYDLARDVLYGEIDVNASNELSGLYTGYTVTLDPNADPSSDAYDKGLNTEHTFPRSQGTGSEPAESDMHHLYATRIGVNSARGSLPFGESVDANTDDWYVQDLQRSTTPDASAPYPIDAWTERDVNTVFEPREVKKGDVARAVLYIATIYESQVDGGFVDGQVDELLQWHADDPVTQSERNRSSAIAVEQGNENPFVLDPTLADRAFGDGTGGGGGSVLTIAEARAEATGTEVTTEGVVTRAKGDFTYIQDASGATGASALTIRQTSGAFHDAVEAGTIEPGTTLHVTGSTSFFSGLQQINEGDLTSWSVVSSGDPLPPPQTVTLSDLHGPDGDDYEAELVRVSDVTVVGASGTFASDTGYDVEDPTQDLGTNPSDPVTLFVPDAENTTVDGTPIPSGAFTFQGVVGQYHGFDFDDAPDTGYQLLAIDATQDVQTSLSIAQARAATPGTEVTTEGVVTRAKGDFTYIQDASGATGASALTIRQTSGAFADAVQNGTIASGTRLRVTGATSFYAGLQQINEGDLANWSVVATDASLPAPQTVTLSTLESDGEDYEAELIRVDGLSFVSATGTFADRTNYDVTDGSVSTFVYRVGAPDDTDLVGESIPSTAFTYEGVLGQFHGADTNDLPDTGYQLLPIQASTALPVEMASFDLDPDADRALLRWTTTSETNNAGFDVQHRSADGAPWTSVGFVEGALHSDAEQRYTFRTAPLAPGVHTFRLRQVDVDGGASYTEEQTVRIVPQPAVRLSGPNPLRSGQSATLTVRVDAKQDVEVGLFNVLGQRVRTLYTGSATPQHAIETTLRVGRLPSGLYFVRVSGERLTAVERIAIVN